MTYPRRTAAIAAMVVGLASGGGVAWACTQPGDPGWPGGTATTTGTTGTTTTTPTTTTSGTTASVVHASKASRVAFASQSALAALKSAVQAGGATRLPPEPGLRQVASIPDHGEIAQLVEHTTENRGVPG